MVSARPWLFALVPSLFLAGCSSVPIPSSDARREVRLITYENVLQVDRACRNLGYKALPFPITLIEGCATYRGGTCTIHARRPYTSTDTAAFRVLGHEALHCFSGDWHRDRQRVKAFEGNADNDLLWNALN